MRGIFGPDDRVELIDGQLLEMTAQGSRHAAIVDYAGQILGGVFGDGCRVQCPLAVGNDAEPEPDLAAVPGRALDSRSA